MAHLTDLPRDIWMLVLTEFLDLDGSMKLTLGISLEWRTLCLQYFIEPIKRKLNDSTSINLQICQSFRIQQQLLDFGKEIDWFHNRDNTLDFGPSFERMVAIKGMSPNVSYDTGIFGRVSRKFLEANMIVYENLDRLLTLAKTITLEYSSYANLQPNIDNFSVFFVYVIMCSKSFECLELIRCRGVHDSMFININQNIQRINSNNPFKEPIPSFYTKLSQLKCIRLMECMQTIVTCHLIDEIGEICKQLEDFVLTYEQLPLRYVDVFEECHGLVKLLTNNKSLKVFHVHYHGTDREALYAAILKSQSLIKIDLMFITHALSTDFMLQMMNKGSFRHVGIIVKPILEARIDIEFGYDNNPEFKSLTIVNNKPKYVWISPMNVDNIDRIFQVHRNFNRITLTNVHRGASSLCVIAQLNPTLSEFRYTESAIKFRKHFTVFSQLCACLMSKKGVFLIDGVPFEQFTDRIVCDLT